MKETGVARDRYAKRGLNGTGQGYLLLHSVGRNIRSRNNHFNKELKQLKCPSPTEMAAANQSRSIFNIETWNWAFRKQKKKINKSANKKILISDAIGLLRKIMWPTNRKVGELMFFHVDVT